jgi:hypothetical protein
MPDRDFPKAPDHREASYSTVERAVLREMIERTMFSICNDAPGQHPGTPSLLDRRRCLRICAVRAGGSRDPAPHPAGRVAR